MPSKATTPSVAATLRRLPLALLAAAVLWLLLVPFYNPLLCGATQDLARVFEYPRAAQVTNDGSFAIIGRSDMRADSGRLRFSLTQITFNLVPFLALTLMLKRPFVRGGWRRFLVALAVLVATHVLTLLWELECFYAFSLGPWSAANYSNLARNVYGGLRYFFEIPVTFALPLVLWVAAFPDQVLTLVGLRPQAERR
jgi:hypothetical protein